MMELIDKLQWVSVNSLLIFTSVVLYLVYFYKFTFSYWKNLGVPCLSVSESFRNTIRLFLRIESFQASYTELYKLFEGHKYGGMYQFTQPLLVLRDPDLIHQILTKGFSHFSYRISPPDPDLDLFGGSLFFTGGDRWRGIRHKVSPAFSSAKLKVMFNNLKECSEEMDNYLQRLTAKTGYVDVEAKKLLSNYTLDVIGACSMGIKCNSIEGGETDFKRITRDVFRFDLRRSIFTFLDHIHPRLPSILRFRACRAEVEEFFMNACKEAEALKEHESAARKDFLAILIQNRKSEESSKEIGDVLFTDRTIAALISSFYSAGYEPIAATMMFCLRELAHHPDVQEKLCAEIDSVLEEIGGGITYESLRQFQYTGQVLDESLRLHPVSPVLRRRCSEKFRIPDSDVVVEKNIEVVFPLYSVQRDEKYWSNPNEFEPERFSEENKKKIQLGTYLPFGEGPRGCIAQRFALMNMKYMLVSLLSKYTFHTTIETQKEISIDPTSFTMKPLGDVILRIQRRE